MACMPKPRHPPHLQGNHDSNLEMLQPLSSPLQFADISSRSSRLTCPLKLQRSASVRAASSLHANNLTFRRRQNLQYVLRIQNGSLLHRSIVGLRPSSEKKQSAFFASASSASYGDDVEEGLLRLGGFCICRKELQIAGAAASTIIFAVANKVLYKMALVPLKEYPFFLALINTFGYIVVYFSILYLRYQAGIVTVEMLEIPKTPFVLSGALEALGLAAGMAAAANLPGTSISILLQTFLVWQLALSLVFLKKSFSFGQLAACGLVLSGVAIALSGSGNGYGLTANGTDLFWPLVMIVSCGFQASSTIVKEFVFQNASKHLKGGSVDIFVVNSFGSAFQSIFVLLMLPFLSHLRGIPFSHLHSYMKDGAGCLFNIGTMSAECSGATLLTLSYVVVNLAFNISLLSLLKKSSAVISSLCSTLAVPIAIYIFTLPLPYVGVTASVHLQFVIGVTVLLSGLALYNFSACHRKNVKPV